MSKLKPSVVPLALLGGLIAANAAVAQTTRRVARTTADNVHPEVQVFDRDLNLIGSVDSPGSPFDIDLSRARNLLVVGSKHVHANIAGNGSDTYAYRVGVPYGPGGADLSDHADFHACLSGANVEAAPECRCIDTDGDGDVDLRDFARLENAFAGL